MNFVKKPLISIESRFSDFMADGILPFEPYSGDNKWAIYSRDGLEIGPLRWGFILVHGLWLAETLAISDRLGQPMPHQFEIPSQKRKMRRIWWYWYVSSSMRSVTINILEMFSFPQCTMAQCTMLNGPWLPGPFRLVRELERSPSIEPVHFKFEFGVVYLVVWTGLPYG